MSVDGKQPEQIPRGTWVLIGLAVLLVGSVLVSAMGWWEPSRIRPQIVLDSSRNVTEGWKIWFALAAMVVVAGWRLFEERPRQLFLGLLAVLCLLNYGRWGARSTVERIDAYDMVHYYLNTKYMDELGYLDLYPCAILADHENDGPRFPEQGPIYMAQDASGHQLQPIGHALARGREVRQNKFTPERWAQFEHDFLFLQRDVRGFTPWHQPKNIPPAFNNQLWRQMIQDRSRPSSCSDFSICFSLGQPSRQWCGPMGEPQLW